MIVCDLVFYEDTEMILFKKIRSTKNYTCWE